jgi:hypothetical protein
MESTISFTINHTAKTGRLTDLTDYSAFGLDPSINQMKFLGTINFQGSPLYSKTTAGDPLIDLQSGATYFEFPLELDSTGAIANGVYSIVDYQVFFTISPISGVNSSASGQTILIPSEGGLADAFAEGNSITFGKTFPLPSAVITTTVVSAESVSGSLLITASSGVLDYSDVAGFLSALTNKATNNYTYSGCSLVDASVNLVSDCNYGDNGTWSVSNTTVTTNQTLVSTSATINYPSWTGEAPIVVTSLPYVNNRLATGTYSVVASFVYSQVENDGLIIQYAALCTQEFDVRCAQPLCSLNKCIENLRIANDAAIKSGKTSPYQVYVDNIALLWIEAQNYLACGQLAEYQTTVEAIQAQLDSSGCECDCCEDGELRWVYNTSESAQTAIEQLQAEVLALQNPDVYNIVIFDSVFPVMDEAVGTLPNNPTFRRPMTDLSEITIDKKYFAPNENGYPKKFVQIDLGVYLDDQNYETFMENVATSTNIAASISFGAQDGEFRVTMKLYTYENGTSGIYQITSSEGFVIDNGPTPNVVTERFYNQNSGLSLFDTTEDLVLNFVPTALEQMGFTYFRITAIGLP